MVSSSILACAAIFLIFFRGPAGLFSVYPEVLSICVLLTGFCWGPRGIVVLLPVCWAILSAAWVSEDRLAAELHGSDLILSGVVCDIPRSDNGVQRFSLVIDADPLHPGIPGRVLVSWYESATQVRAGERWKLKLRLKRPRGTSNPGGFDFERWTFMRRIGATGYVRASPVNRRLAADCDRCGLAAFRQDIATKILAANPGGSASAHVLALAVGIRNRLDKHDWAVLRRTGTAHLMAISGLHVGLAAGFAFLGFRQFGRSLLYLWNGCRPLILARAGALIGAAGYSALAGFSVPTIRALVMTAVVIVLTGLRRTMPPPVILSAALYAVLWVSPFAMLSPGFWFSFGAVFVLLLSGFGKTATANNARIQGSRIRRALQWLRMGLRAQLCLSAGLMPATAFFFSQVSVVAPIANLIVVPLFAASIVPLIMIGVMALIVLPVLASPVLWLADSVLSGLLGLLEGINRLTLAAIDMPGVTGLMAGIWAAIAMVLIFPVPLPGRIRIVAALLVLMTCVDMRRAGPPLRLVVMDVGQGLAVLLQTPAHAVLFDTGPRYRRGDAGRSIVIPVLQYFGVTRLDRLIVSHGDSDHAGGVRSILDAYPEAELLAPERLDIPLTGFQPCRAGQYWQHDGVSFRFLHPDSAGRTGPWTENDASCVLLVQTAKTGLLLPGDIEQGAERWLVAHDAIPSVDLVVAPHHGSRTSSTAAFVAATRPEFVIFSAGYLNRWRFPAAVVLDRWSAVDACALITGQTGAIVFEAQADGSLRLVQRYRLDQARIWNEPGSIESSIGRCHSLASTN